MSDLRPNLFDTDFEQLLGQSRAMLPKLAPAWTNHNLHDPGIMLIELLSWTAEAQIYSLARLRTDERWAFAALLGFYPRGPVPARGMVWPTEGQNLWGNLGALLASGAEATVAGQPLLPTFRLSQPLNLTAARLVGVESRLHDGRILQHTATNLRTGAGFYPFGEQAQAGDRLVLTFQGPLLAPDSTGLSARDTYLSLGVRVPPSASPPPPLDPEAPRIRASLLDGQIRYPLPVKADGSHGFLRSGPILLGLGEVPANLSETFAIEIESQTSGFFGPPWVLSIQPNVLPIEQIASRQVVYAGWSDGLPDQAQRLEDTGAGLPASLPYPIVRLIPEGGGTAVEWLRTDDLSKAEPGDLFFGFDSSARQIRFGNGLNGAIPPPGASLELAYEATEGADGNLSAELDWQVVGLQGVFGKNLDPTTGGDAALDLLDMRRLARASVREDHAIVTSEDLKKAALALADLRVVRAEALPAPDLGKHCATLNDTRTLVALRARPALETPGLPPENPLWLAEVRRELVGRLPLGERLRVIAPDYLALRLQATLLAWPGFDPQAIAEQALAAMAAYFRLVGGTEVWPLGREASLLEVRGRLFRLEGVAAVQDCALLWGESTAPIAQPVFSKTFLPLLRTGQSQIVVERSPVETLP